MKLHKELFNAEATTYWTSQRMQFHFFLTEVAAWDGFIPLTIKEIASEMSIHPDTVRRFICQAQFEGVVSQDIDGNLFLRKCATYESAGKKEPYVRHYAFLRSSGFLALSERTQKFIMHFLQYGLHEPTVKPVRIVKKLFHTYTSEKGERRLVSRGVFNIYARKDMKAVIKEAQTFLNIEEYTNRSGEDVIKICGIKDIYVNEIVENRGKLLWIEKALDKHGFIREEIHKDMIFVLSNIMDKCVSSFGFHTSAQLFEESLSHAVESTTFQSLLFTNDSKALRNYFNTVLRKMEENYVSGLAEQLNKYEQMQQTTKRLNLLHAFGHHFLQAARSVKLKLLTAEQTWKKRLINSKDPLTFERLSKMKQVLAYMPDLCLVVTKLKNNGYLEKQREALNTSLFYNWLEPTAE